MTACSHCDFVDWQNPVPVAAAIIEYDDQILLVRNVGWPEKMFALVSGYVDYHESPEETIVREIKEETSLDATVTDFLGHLNFRMKNQLMIGFTCRAEGRIELNEELEEFKIIPKEKLKAWPMGTGPFVQTWIDRNL